MRLLTLARPLLLVTVMHAVPAAAQAAALTAKQPPAPIPNAPAPAPAPMTCTVIGIVADPGGDSLPEAVVTLTPEGQPPAETTTAEDGSFTFVRIPPGAFTISIHAEGFGPRQQSGVLQPGQTLDLSQIALAPASTTTLDVVASREEIAQAQMKDEEKQRILGAIPNFYVVYDSNPAPLDPKQKYELAFRTLIDPVTFVFNGIAAGAQQAANTYAWGQGAQGYAKRFAAGYGNAVTGILLEGAVFPVLFKQDPRYFYKGTGSTASRAGYAIANAVVCKGDNMHWQFNISGILGGLVSSGLSNAYYPAANRNGAALTFEGLAIGTGVSAVSNLFQEFVIHRLTPHVAHRDPATQPAVSP